jgi:Ca-activated chloride channel family protein
MKALLRSFAALSAAFLLASPVLHAHGIIVVNHAHGRHIHPPIVPPGHFSFAPLSVKEVSVHTKIHDLRVETTVEQLFHNPNSSRLEGTWIFPLPLGARIDSFHMDIDGKMTEAELLSADKARGIYEQIVREMKDPALLEYDGREALKLRIFPIEPRSDKRIRLTYTQLLTDDSGILEHTVTPGTEKFSATPVGKISVTVDIQSATPIRSVYSPSHEAEIKRTNDQHATLTYEAKNARPDSPFRIVITRDRKPVGVHLLTHRPDAGDDGYFMILASPGKTPPAAVQPKDICFVLDTSGSMADGKLDQAKKALRFCLANLNDEDRFEIIPFATEAEPVFGKLVDATEENRTKAAAAVKALKPIGGTAIGEALDKALSTTKKTNDVKDRPRLVVFLTDGLPTVGETRQDPLVDLVRTRNTDGLRIFSLGVGHDVNTHLLDRIAEETRAFSQYVSPTEDLELKLSRFYSKIKDPVLTGLEIEFDIPGVRTTKLQPIRLPDLFDGDMLVAFGRYSGHGEGKIKISGDFLGERRSFDSGVLFPKSAEAHDYIPGLWAARRVGWLLDEIRMRGESAELIEETTRLARKHGIVTPYTAYLIIEDEKKRGVPVAQRNFREMEADAPVLARAEGRMRSLGREAADVSARSGDFATSNASSLQALKSQTASSDVGAGGGSVVREELAKASAASAPAAQGYRLSQSQHYATQSRTLNGRAFYQNSGVWQDSTAQAKPGLAAVNITFNSQAWFDLLHKHPEARPWLSLGSDIDVVIEDQLYQIRG